METQSFSVDEEKLLAKNKLYFSAKDFYQDIQKFIYRDSDAGGIIRQSYIFRGQANSEWGLVPSSLRNKYLKEKLLSKKQLVKNRESIASLIENDIDLDDVCLELEYKHVYTFLYFADKNGLFVPDYDISICSSYNDFIGSVMQYPFKNKYPYGDGTQLRENKAMRHYALAQHYRVPTRLLDWTENPLVAIYMACIEALIHNTVNPNAQYESFSVWIMRDISEFLPIYTRQKHDSDNVSPIISIFRVPYNGNKNMIAQSGLFTYCCLQKLGEEDFTWDIIGLEEIRRDAFNSNEIYSTFYKYSLAKSEFKDMLLILERLGVTAASIYPGFEGVKKYIDEKKLYY